MALDSLTRYLAQRDHSELELRQKLSRRYSRETIEKVLAEALARKWLCEPTELAERVRVTLADPDLGQVRSALSRLVDAFASEHAQTHTTGAAPK